MLNENLLVALDKEWYKTKVTQEEKARYTGYKEVTHSRMTEGNANNDWRPEKVYSVKKEWVSISESEYRRFGGKKDIIDRKIVPYKDYRDCDKELVKLEDEKVNLTNVKKKISLTKKAIKLLEEVKELAQYQVEMINECIAMYDYIEANEFINEFLTVELTYYASGECLQDYREKLKNYETTLGELEEVRLNNKKQKELAKLEKEKKLLRKK